MTGSAPMDAERAFTQASRQRRRAAAKRWLRRRPGSCGRLAVYGDDARPTASTGAVRGVREIPLEAIAGTVEPHRATLFDGGFRPSRAARDRWQRVWMAEQRGAVLPPIDVVRVGDAYAVSDGHHRVSVAKARGGVMIDAVVVA